MVSYSQSYLFVNSMSSIFKCYSQINIFPASTSFLTKVSIALSLHKKWSFPIRITSLNVTKSSVSRGFGHIYWKNSQWKTETISFVKLMWKCSFFIGIWNTNSLMLACFWKYLFRESTVCIRHYKKISFKKNCFTVNVIKRL